MAVAAIAEVVAVVTVMMTDMAEEEEAEGTETTATIPAVVTATTTAMARQEAEMQFLRLGHLTVSVTMIPERFPADRISPVLGAAGTPVDVKIRIDAYAA